MNVFIVLIVSVMFGGFKYLVNKINIYQFVFFGIDVVFVMM